MIAGAGIAARRFVLALSIPGCFIAVVCRGFVAIWEVYALVRVALNGNESIFAIACITVSLFI